MTQCNNAFSLPIQDREYYLELLQKIHVLADVIVAYCEEIMGYIAVYANDLKEYTAFVTLLAVKPSYQRQGIGMRLLKEAELLARQRGMRRIRLEVRKDNVDAIRFYKNNGFWEESETPESWYMIKALA